MNRIILFSVLTITLLFSTASSILVQPVNAIPEWWDDDWNFRKKITIDYTKVNCDLTNFPVLIFLASDADLVADAQSDGGDIAFTDSNQQQLDHEIEFFDVSTGELYAWVRIPNLSSISDTEIYMYYGNAGASSQQNPTGVWDSNYKMVQHLDEKTGSHQDSTSNNNDGTPFGGVTQDFTGVIDGADDFDGTDNFIDFGNDPSLGITDKITFEAWINPDGTPTEDWNLLIRSIDSYGEVTPYKFYLLQSSGYLAFYTTTSSIVDSGEEVVVDKWSHIAVTVDTSSNTVQFYINGSLVASKSGSLGSDNNGKVELAAYNNDEFFDGSMDEVRVSNKVRNLCWVTTSFENQKDPAGFRTVGSEELLSNFQSNIIITADPISGSDIIKVDGAYITTGDDFDWIIGSTHTLEAISPKIISGDRYVWSSWSDSGAQSHSYTVPSVGETVTAYYTKQYYLTVNSVYDDPQGEGWYDEGDTATFSVTSPSIEETGTRYIAMGFRIDGGYLVEDMIGSVPMYDNHTVTFYWNERPQYYLTVNSTYGTTHGEDWYNEGASPTFYVTPEIVEEDGVRHVFQGWEGDYIDGANPAGAHQIVMDGPKTVTAVWRDRFFIEIISPYGSPPGSSWPFRGENFEVSVTSPDSGFVVTGYKVDGGSLQSGSSHMFINVQATHTIEFVWELLIETTTFTFNLSTNPGNKGTIAVGTTVYDDGDSIITTGGSYTIQANPNDDYIFSRWQTSGGVSVSDAEDSTTTCTVSDDGTLTMIQDSIPTSAAPGVWGGPETQFQCIIATAAYGSTMAPEVAYMRNVRDNMIGSTPIGNTLVTGFNTFYYSWSPLVAQRIADSEGLRTTFRVLLLPISAAVHSAELTYTTVSPFNPTMASVTAFLLAAAISIGSYIIAPIFAGLTIYRKKYASHT